MPNYVTNLIRLEGEDELIKKALSEIITINNPIIRRDYKGNIMLKKKNENFPVEYFYFDKNKETLSDRSRNIINNPIWEEYEVLFSEQTKTFDFNNIIPAPISSPSYNDIPTQEIAKEYPTWWYNWNINNWNTKWNSTEYEEINLYNHVFKTAWSGVSKIIEAISIKYPDLKIGYVYADEDIGNNIGASVWKNGECLGMIYFNSGEKLGYELAFALHPGASLSYKETDDGYVYDEHAEEEPLDSDSDYDFVIITDILNICEAEPED